jgi:hypothetical protein
VVTLLLAMVVGVLGVPIWTELRRPVGTCMHHAMSRKKIENLHDYVICKVHVISKRNLWNQYSTSALLPQEFVEGKWAE